MNTANIEMKTENKIVILDTNVFLHDPNSLMGFPGMTIVVPLIVIEELDKFKREMDDIGKAARLVIRYLDKLKLKAKLTEGVPLDNGGILKVQILDKDAPGVPSGLDSKVKDNYLLRTAILYQRKGGYEIKLITKDANLRIKADSLDIATADYNHSTIQKEDNFYTGYREIGVEDDLVAKFYQENKISEDELLHSNMIFVKNASTPESGNEKKDNYPSVGALRKGEYLHLQGPSSSALGKWLSSENQIGPLTFPKEGAWGIQPRNREQRFAFDALLDPAKKLVTISGSAGTGKTLIAIACGLYQVTEQELFQKLLVARPIIPMGKELGFLPGEMGEKLKPWMQPIFDNLELILGKNSEQAMAKGADKKFTVQDAIKDMMQMQILQVEPLTYIRGRSIPNQYLIVDEAQNLSPHEVKTIITRAGEGTKIVLTGDPDQIDHPYLNSYSNGLTFAMLRFREQDIAAHITLKKGERSALAELAAKLLN